MLKLEVPEENPRYRHETLRRLYLCYRPDLLHSQAGDHQIISPSRIQNNILRIHPAPMTAFIEYERPPTLAPLHVLIVVVGKYDQAPMNLKGAGQLAQDLCNFWKDENRVYPADLALGSIEVLVTDPDVATYVLHSNRQSKPDAPTSQSVKDAMRRWAERIESEDGAAGVLHWVGHGFQSSEGTDGLVLYCEGVMRGGEQDGLSWDLSRHWLDDVTSGHPVYCFIDCCRKVKVATARYEGLGTCGMSMSDNAVVIFAASYDKKAFWVEGLNQAANDAGCKPQALGTRAFLQALESFGARDDANSPDGRMPITPNAVIDAVDPLLKRWRRHLGIPVSGKEGPRISRSTNDTLLYTSSPMSVVDVKLQRVANTNDCKAKPAQGGPEKVPENGGSPFEFRLARVPHRFKLGAGGWLGDLEIQHPHVRIVDGVYTS